MRYLPYFTAAERRRFSVKPGITGWAQINGRNHSSWDQRFRDDLWYVEHWSFWLDLRILLITLKQVVRGRGVVADARSIMPNLDEERAETVRHDLATQGSFRT
jgi:lipopolysaccharide/colanic/teichoic acid biosynthesis glycosyltransferase